MSRGDHRTSIDGLDPAAAIAVADTMQALATPSRVLILSRLHAAPRAVSELATDIGMEPSAVSHQLRVLRHLGLVVGRREGRRVIYALHDEHVGALLLEAVWHAEHLARPGAAFGPAGQEAAA